MSTKNITLIVIGALILILGWTGCNGYNGLVVQDENVNNAWNKVQSDYQRRADLIPNLVNTVKGEANFEQETLTKVIEARASATQMKIDPKDLTPEKLEQFQAAQGQLSQALGRLLVVTENYPNLRANEAFRGLQTQLEGTENRIKTARNDFNDAVKDYNVKVRRFPMNIFAGMFGFRPKEGFKAEAGAEKAPEVKF
ncbi:MAG: LemA family protein [Chitinophagaceae bacterium]|jgi:LemA protein|nr:LemA family protein [Chitinophagaceae bacterium]MCA6466674.1 LemA family protein [Chitinophagaceae bacterium]MCA6471721.1 LemA family protein [Chitinophagaceae bacterium]MCA6474094.1 LemA family protein [Chitinophagaceae bacterium]MCA6478458.1 LemA family protein [Chitinophagaceae bacterium]